MKQSVSYLLGLAFFSCLGCQTLQVKRAPVPPPPAVNGHQVKAESVPGLPFYVKKAACLHTVVWFEPVYTLSLDLVTTPTSGASKPTTAQLGSTVLSLAQLQASPAQDLFHALNGDSPTIQSVMKAWVPVATQNGTPYTPTAFPTPDRLILISNISEPQTYVDYSQPYYINAKRPVAGSVKLDNKLASDGTLTEVSAEVEEKTIEAITTGIKDIVSAVGTAAKAEVVPNTVQHLKLSVATTGFKQHYRSSSPSLVFPVMRSRLKSRCHTNTRGQRSARRATQRNRIQKDRRLPFPAKLCFPSRRHRQTIQKSPLPCRHQPEQKRHPNEGSDRVRRVGVSGSRCGRMPFPTTNATG
jgi:hypothetical protein